MEQKSNVISVFDLFAQRYSDQYLNAHMYRDTLEEFAALLSSNRLLEIACGPGNITKTLLDINEDLSILGIDISPEMIAIAEKNIPTATFKVHDILQLKTLEEMFPAILVGFCFPYLNKKEVREALHNIASCSEKHTTLYISTIGGNYNNSAVASSSTGEGIPLKIHYYDLDFFRGELSLYNFTISHHFVKERPTKSGAIENDLIIIAQR